MSSRDIANYVIYKIVMDLGKYLTTEFLELFLPYDNATIGIAKSSPRWENCMGEVGDLYGKGLKDFKVALGAMYARAFLSPDDKTAAEDIMKNLKTEFRKMLTEADWMDPKTQAEAEKKMDKMISTVGYPEEGFI